MTLILDLPPELEARIHGEATRRGLPLATYVLELLAAVTPSEAAPIKSPVGTTTPEPTENTGAESRTRQLTGAEIVAKWRRKGLIGTRPDIEDSVEFVQQMRRQAETRDWS